MSKKRIPQLRKKKIFEMEKKIPSTPQLRKKISDPHTSLFFPTINSQDMSSISGTKRDASQIQEEVTLLSMKLEVAKERLARQKKIEKLVDALQCTTCMICSEELVDCIQEDMSISCYECRCSTQRVVHTKCWTRSFRCSCREMQELPAEVNKIAAMQPVVKNVWDIEVNGALLSTTLGIVKSDLHKFGLECQEGEGFSENIKRKLDAIKVSIVTAEGQALGIRQRATLSKSTLDDLGYRREEEVEEDEEEVESLSSVEEREEVARSQASVEHLFAASAGSPPGSPDR